MWGFAWMFWLIPFLFFCMMTRHWRRERWAHGRYGSTRTPRELDEQRDYADSLERRVADPGGAAGLHRAAAGATEPGRVRSRMMAP